jgi:hypothetical protein
MVISAGPDWNSYPRGRPAVLGTCQLSLSHSFSVRLGGSGGVAPPDLRGGPVALPRFCGGDADRRVHHGAGGDQPDSRVPPAPPRRGPPPRGSHSGWLTAPDEPRMFRLAPQGPMEFLSRLKSFSEMESKTRRCPIGSASNARRDSRSAQLCVSQLGLCEPGSPGSFGSALRAPPSDDRSPAGPA